MKDALVDVDGVVADWLLAIMCELCSDRRDEDFKGWEILSQLDDEDRELALSVMESPEFWRHLPVMKGAKEGIRELEKAGYRITWVTSPWRGCTGWEDARRGWLNEHFDMEERGHGFIPTAEKHMVDGNIFIDDKPENVRKWAMEHPHRRAFLFVSPRTKDDPWPDKFTWDRVREIA